MPTVYFSVIDVAGQYSMKAVWRQSRFLYDKSFPSSIKEKAKALRAKADELLKSATELEASL